MIDLARVQIMNAAGWCKTTEEVERLSKTPVTEITVGSITLAERLGNAGTVFWESPSNEYALNSLGLPNVGLSKIVALLPEMRSIAEKSGKLLRVSVAGFSTDEYATLAAGVCKDADVIELNCGCPNVWGTSGQKPIAAFNPKTLDHLFLEVRHALDSMSTPRRIAVKLSPYSDPGLLKEVAAVVLLHSSLIDEVVTCNTFPNALSLIDGVPAITPGSGFAGLSGRAMKPIMLGQAASFVNELSAKHIDVTGVGGVRTGLDVLDLLHLKVERVQVGTHYFLHGPRVFSEILGELAALV